MITNVWFNIEYVEALSVLFLDWQHVLPRFSAEFFSTGIFFWPPSDSCIFVNCPSVLLYVFAYLEVIRGCSITYGFFMFVLCVVELLNFLTL